MLFRSLFPPKLQPGHLIRIGCRGVIHHAFVLGAMNCAPTVSRRSFSRDKPREFHMQRGSIAFVVRFVMGDEAVISPDRSFSL